MLDGSPVARNSKWQNPFTFSTLEAKWTPTVFGIQHALSLREIWGRSKFWTGQCHGFEMIMEKYYSRRLRRYFGSGQNIWTPYSSASGKSFSKDWLSWSSYGRRANKVIFARRHLVIQYSLPSQFYGEECELNSDTEQLELEGE